MFLLLWEKTGKLTPLIRIFFSTIIIRKIIIEYSYSIMIN